MVMNFNISSEDCMKAITPILELKFGKEILIPGIENKISNTESNLEDTKKNYENAKIEIKRPFPQEEELKAKSKRLDELNIKLNLNEKDKETHSRRILEIRIIEMISSYDFHSRL